jgi:hypothetical protein
MMAAAGEFLTPHPILTQAHSKERERDENGRRDGRVDTREQWIRERIRCCSLYKKGLSIYSI